MLDLALAFVTKARRISRRISWTLTIFALLMILQPDLGKPWETIRPLLFAIPIAIAMRLITDHWIKPLARRMWRPFAMLGVRLLAKAAG